METSVDIGNLISESFFPELCGHGHMKNIGKRESTNCKLQLTQYGIHQHVSKDASAFLHSDCELPGTSVYLEGRQRSLFRLGKGIHQTGERGVACGPALQDYRVPEAMLRGVQDGERSAPTIFDNEAGLNATNAFFGDDMEEPLAIDH
uniref:Uncharacterized protein n=1 Tax=Caenorhabditis tropicalis TaxID=1561998 RepID=A0A1I7T1Y6_9PELO